MKASDFWELKRLCHWDKLLREKKLSMCDGKFKHKTFETALRAIREKLRHKTEPYHCPICGAWHVGSR